MSILQIDKRKTPKLTNPLSQISWQQKFKRNLYSDNYSKYFKKQPQQDLLLQQQTNQASYAILSQIKQAKNSSLSFSHQNRQYYDPQILNTFYSPYSLYIPLEDQSYLNDQIINTFPYLLYLKENARREELLEFYEKFKKFFGKGKAQGREFVMQQWGNVKRMYLCRLDSVMAVSLMIQLMRKNTSIISSLYQAYGQPTIPQIFLHRVQKSLTYIRPTLKIHQKLQLSIQLSDQINEKTLPMVMKTWYCSLCLCYDCQKHKLQMKVVDYEYHYQSKKNRVGEMEKMQDVVRLLTRFEEIKEGDGKEMVDEGKQNGQVDRRKGKTCSIDCYKVLLKKDIPKLYRTRHKLISPLAKSLLKLGIEMFSYNPCKISHLFTSKSSNDKISCSQIFIHFIEQQNLQNIIQNKFNCSQSSHLQNQPSKILNMNIKIPNNQIKVKRLHYLEQRHKNQYPEFAVCMHCFVGVNDIDVRCQKCVCKDRGFCLPSCLCTEACGLQRIGCTCRGLDSCQTEKQCQPEICGQCFTGRHQKKNCCKNDQILRNADRKIHIGVSRIPGAGIGAFAGQSFSKNDLICKYTGQHINSEVDFIRQAMIKDLSFYNFDSPNGKIVSASIDARFMGNKARFINHGNQGQQNLKAQNIFSNGTQYIVLIAARDIAEGEELSFNYDGNGQLYANHREKYPFIKPPGSNWKKN